MSNCRWCGAAIRWVECDEGWMLPLDVDPVPHGNVVPVQRGDRMFAVVYGPDDGRPDGDAWTLHTSTCPLIIGDARP